MWGGGGGVSPSHGREIFENSCIKLTSSFLHIKCHFLHLFYSLINGRGAGAAWQLVPSLATLMTVV